jgi:GxxExxY protein
MDYEEITETIIGCCYTVYNQLGFGFLESVYAKALMIELNKFGLKARGQVAIEVVYDGLIIGDFLADLLVEDIVLVELKSVRTVTKAHEAQLVNYLTATRKPVGLLINFAETEVQVRRRTPRFASAQNDPLDPLILSKNPTNGF